jgi:hypothetical protein
MATFRSKGRAADFFLQCLSLSSPAGRVTVIAGALVFLGFVNVDALPDLCLWEKIFGWCPARGTTRALSAFFHGEWSAAVRYNVNVVVLVPALFCILLSDVVKIVRKRL